MYIRFTAKEVLVRGNRITNDFWWSQLSKEPFIDKFYTSNWFNYLKKKKKKKHLAKKTSSADDVYWLELPLYSLKKRDNMWRNYNIAEKYKFWYCILAVVLDSLFFNGLSNKVM